MNDIEITYDPIRRNFSRAEIIEELNRWMIANMDNPTFLPADQRADLCEMVKLCQSLNNGSGIVFKINRLEEIARELTRTDWDKPECSFIEWARRKVEEDRKE